MDESLAEFIGIHIGDGNLYIHGFEQVNRWFEIIGSHNPHRIERYEKYVLLE